MESAAPPPPSDPPPHPAPGPTAAPEAPPPPADDGDDNDDFTVNSAMPPPAPVLGGFLGDIAKFSKAKLKKAAPAAGDDESAAAAPAKAEPLVGGLQSQILSGLKGLKKRAEQEVRKEVAKSKEEDGVNMLRAQLNRRNSMISGQADRIERRASMNARPTLLSVADGDGSESDDISSVGSGSDSGDTVSLYSMPAVLKASVGPPSSATLKETAPAEKQRTFSRDKSIFNSSTVNGMLLGQQTGSGDDSSDDSDADNWDEDEDEDD